MSISSPLFLAMRTRRSDVPEPSILYPTRDGTPPDVRTITFEIAIALSPELDPDETKARILRRTDGRPTYFGADIVYHFSKFRHAD